MERIIRKSTDDEKIRDAEVREQVMKEFPLDQVDMIHRTYQIVEKVLSLLSDQDNQSRLAFEAVKEWITNPTAKNATNCYIAARDVQDDGHSPWNASSFRAAAARTAIVHIAYAASYAAHNGSIRPNIAYARRHAAEAITSAERAALR